MKIKNILSTLAPTLGTALGGPLGGMAAKFAVEKLLPGAKPADTDDAVEMLQKFVSGANPEQLAQLKQIENEFKLKMKELGIRESELEYQDRDSARKMAMTAGIAPQIVLSGIYTLGYFLVMYVFLTGGISIAQDLKSEFNIVLGVMTTAQVQIMNFWFGSSSGSKEKTEKLAGA